MIIIDRPALFDQFNNVAFKYVVNNQILWQLESAL